MPVSRKPKISLGIGLYVFFGVFFPNTNEKSHSYVIRQSRSKIQCTKTKKIVHWIYFECSWTISIKAHNWIPWNIILIYCMPNSLYCTLMYTGSHRHMRPFIFNNYLFICLFLWGGGILRGHYFVCLFVPAILENTFMGGANIILENLHRQMQY